METDAEDQRRGRERLLLGDEARYSHHEVAEKAGVTLAQATAVWRALGFPAPDPADPAFTDADVEALRTLSSIVAATGIEESVHLSMTRSIGQAMGRLADAQLGNFARILEDQIPDPQADSAQLAAIAAAESILPMLELVQRYVWRRHLFAASEQVFTHLSQPADCVPEVVGFADISGFTALSRGLGRSRLEEVIENFEAATSAVIADHGGRVVKTLGDEVMFLAGTPASAAEIGVELSRWASELDGGPVLHVGMALGPVLHKLGDVYGTVVNIASRLTSLARTGTVLIDRELADAIAEDSRYQLRRLRPVRVRGFSQLQPWLLRHR